MNCGSSFCITCKNTFRSGLCKFSIPEGGALIHHPEGAVVSRPLAGPVRSAEGYPPLPSITGYAAIHKLSQLVYLPKEIGKPATASFSAEEHEKPCSLKS